MTGNPITRALLAAVLAAASAAARAQAPEPTFTTRSLTPDTALEAARAALKKCRDGGYQVAVAVVDRSGLVQVMLRDRYAGAHTPDTAIGKAWTAVSFRTSTADMASQTRPDRPAGGIRHLPRAVMVAGGIPVEAAGALLGGIGVSGAPGGDLDEACAKAGLEAIRDKLEF